MSLPDPVALIDSLTRAGARAVIVSTGGGSQAISQLVTTPGASAVVLEGLVPYAREAVDKLLGGPQENYCSSRIARRLAAVAWQRACELGASPGQAVGSAVAASLRTRSAKRGAHRMFVATQTLAATATAALELEKGARTRAEEEILAATLVLAQLQAAGVPGAGDSLAGSLRPGERVVFDRLDAPPDWSALLAGTRRASLVGAAAAEGIAAEPTTDRLVFPGSFDPLHEGHRLMARLAEEIAERPVEFELSITNVAKPALDYIEIRSRVAQFAGQTLWLTRAATFLEKLEIFPRCTFVLGADTFTRLADPRYYGGSQAAADQAVATIARGARGLIVFGRVRGGVFEETAKLDVPQPLRDISYFVSEREFRMDVSSTTLRRERLACEPS